MFNSGNSGIPFTMNVEPSGSSNGNNNGGFGDMGAWWIVIFVLFFAFGGWGGNGFGNNGGGSNGSVMDAYVLNSDFATLQRQIDSGFANTTAGINQVNNGLCNGFYQQAQLVNGVQMQIANEARTTDNAICNLGTAMQQGFNQSNITALQGQNALATQIADCCCKNQTGQMQIANEIERTTCAITNAINQASQAQMQNCNNNYRALHDEIVANRIEDKNATIAAQNQQIFQLQLAASQADQNNYLVNQLRPCPTPAYITCNPWAANYGIGYNSCGCGNNNGCGCC